MKGSSSRIAELCHDPGNAVCFSIITQLNHSAVGLWRSLARRCSIRPCCFFALIAADRPMEHRIRFFNGPVSPFYSASDLETTDGIQHCVAIWSPEIADFEIG